MYRLILYVIFASQLSLLALAVCPCATEDLCKPVTKQYEKELVVFSAHSDYEKWNWTAITNLVALCDFTKPDCLSLYCYAHSKNARVTKLVRVPVSDFPKLTNVTYRHQVLQSWLTWVTKYNLDGLNIDIEGPTHSRDVKEAITDLTRDTYYALKSKNPFYSVTWDIPFTSDQPYCVDSSCFDYASLAEYTDYMLVMDYDMLTDGPIATANSPYNLLPPTYDRFINKLSIDANHLVMGIPWYGYDVACKYFFNSTGGNVCVKKSDRQIGFGQIMQLFKQNIGGLKWDHAALSPYFTIKQSGFYHQLRFDNIESLSFKFDFGVKLGLRGFGMWNADELNYTWTDPAVMHRTKSMWNTISKYAMMLHDSSVLKSKIFQEI